MSDKKSLDYIVCGLAYGFKMADKERSGASPLSSRSSHPHKTSLRGSVRKRRSG